MKKRKKDIDWEEKIANFCYKAIWPVLVIWILAALAKIIIVIPNIT